MTRVDRFVGWFLRLDIGLFGLNVLYCFIVTILVTLQNDQHGVSGFIFTMLVGCGGYATLKLIQGLGRAILWQRRDLAIAYAQLDFHHATTNKNGRPVTQDNCAICALVVLTEAPIEGTHSHTPQ